MDQQVIAPCAQSPQQAPLGGGSGRESALLPSAVDRVQHGRWPGGAPSIERGIDIDTSASISACGMARCERREHRRGRAVRHRDGAAWSRARDGLLTGERGPSSGLAMVVNDTKIRAPSPVRTRCYVSAHLLRGPRSRWIGAFGVSIRGYNSGVQFALGVVARIVHFIVHATGAPNRQRSPCHLTPSTPR